MASGIMSGAGGGGAGLGGAIFVRSGSLVMSECALTGNAATGGMGGSGFESGGVDGQGAGGALFVSVGATATLVDPTFSGNSAADGANVYGSVIYPPWVVSVARSGTTPTSSASVGFTVTFSEDVTGVASTDFAVTTVTGDATGIASVVTLVTASAYTVTVDSVTGDGMLRLDLIDDDSIIDVTSDPLGGSGFNDYTEGEVYTIDNTPPTFAAISATPDPANAADTLTITFTASETLAVSPDVMVDGNAASFVLLLGLDYTYDYIVSGSETEGPVTISVSGSDPVGHAGADNGTVTLDFTSPGAPSGASASDGGCSATGGGCGLLALLLSLGMLVCLRRRRRTVRA